MRLSTFALVLPILLLFAGCSQDPVAQTKTYDFHGQIVAVNSGDSTITVNHDAIGDWMEAMTMEYPLKNPDDIFQLKVGDIIDAKLEVAGLEYHLTDITVIGNASDQGSSDSGEAPGMPGMDMGGSEPTPESSH